MLTILKEKRNLLNHQALPSLVYLTYIINYHTYSMSKALRFMLWFISLDHHYQTFSILFIHHLCCALSFLLPALEQDSPVLVDHQLQADDGGRGATDGHLLLLQGQPVDRPVEVPLDASHCDRFLWKILFNCRFPSFGRADLCIISNCIFQSIWNIFAEMGQQRTEMSP